MVKYLQIIVLLFLAPTVIAQNTGELEIVDIFNVTGRGTVLVGSLESGSFRVGDEVDLVKPGQSITSKLTITGIEQFRRSLQIANKVGEQYGFLVQEAVNFDSAEKGDRLIRMADITKQNFVFSGFESVSLTGKGTVLNGIIRSGRIAIGDQVEVIGSDYNRRISVVTEILINRQVVSTATAGENAALVLRGIDRGDVGRGTVVATPGTIQQTNVIGVLVTLKEEISVPDETLYLFGSYVLNSDTRVMILQAGSPSVLQTGTQKKFFLSSGRPIVVNIGESIVLRKAGSIVAEGTVTDIGLP